MHKVVSLPLSFAPPAALGGGRPWPHFPTPGEIADAAPGSLDPVATGSQR